MTPVRNALAAYLSMRRAFGYKLHAHEGMLGQFVAFLEQAGAITVTTDLALRWAADASGSENRKAVRLSMVRGFAAYLRTIDPATHAPHQADHRARPAPLRGRLGYVAARGVSAAHGGVRPGCGHITRGCYSQTWSSHSRRSWSAVQLGSGSGVSDW